MYGKEWRRVVREERELGRWTRKKKRTTGHGRDELRVLIGAFSNFYITFVAGLRPSLLVIDCIKSLYTYCIAL